MASPTKLIVADPSKGIKVDSGIVAKSFRDEIKQKVEDLKKEGIGKHAMECHVTSCHGMACHAIPCHASCSNNTF